MKRKASTVIVGALGALALVAATTSLAAGAPRRAGAQSRATQVYVAQLDALNEGTHTTEGGTFTISETSGVAGAKVKGDRLVLGALVSGVNPLTLHPQHIHAGSTCPIDGEDDANGDGFVDVIEGLPDYGPILVNMDSDLSSNAAGAFPTANANGMYRYRENGSVSQIEAEIGEDLALDTRHVVIHGVDPSTPLPDTVQSLPGLPAWATLPVGCGELVNVR